MYRLCGEEHVDEAALFLGGAPSWRSCALSVVPSSIEDYQAELWDKCIEVAESTFGALYMFTNIWWWRSECRRVHCISAQVFESAGGQHKLESSLVTRLVSSSLLLSLLHLALLLLAHL